MLGPVELRCSTSLGSGVFYERLLPCNCSSAFIDSASPENSVPSISGYMIELCSLATCELSSGFSPIRILVLRLADGVLISVKVRFRPCSPSLRDLRAVCEPPGVSCPVARINELFLLFLLVLASLLLVGCVSRASTACP